MTTITLNHANDNSGDLTNLLDKSGLNAEIDQAFPEEFTPAERALLMADAKAHYEKLFPQTKAGAAQALGSKRAHGLTSGQTPAPAFVTIVVNRAQGRRGWSESSIKQVVLRGERIARAVLDAIIKGGEFDTGARLDELVGLAKPYQMAHYVSWKSGQPPTPPAPALPQTNEWRRGRGGVIDNADRFCIPGVVNLYRGDSKDVLPALHQQGVRVDLIASDVPYGIDCKDQDGEGIANDKDAVETSGWAVPGMLGLLKDDGFAFVCTRWDVAHIWSHRHEACGAPVSSRIVWDKKVPNGRPSPFVSRTEDILVARKGEAKLREWVNDPRADFGDETMGLERGFEDKEIGRVVKADIDLWPISSPRGHGAGDCHFMRKPVAMGIRMMLNGSDEGQTVLDAFMGTGPFAVAAILTGREFIGIELDDEYFAEAVRRVKAALREVGAPVVAVSLAA